jgi:restriction endonuclease Mrr
MLSVFSFDVKILERVKGRSGIKHEVDIVAEKKDASPVRLLIKCKSQTEETTLRLDEVLSFWAQLFDSSADRGIIVTTCKVAEAAVKFAEYHRIMIVSGKRPQELRYKILKCEMFLSS